MAKKRSRDYRDWPWAGRTFDPINHIVWSDKTAASEAPEFTHLKETLQSFAVQDRRGYVGAAAFAIATTAMWRDLHDQPNLQLNRGPAPKKADLDELQRLHDLLFNIAVHLHSMHLKPRNALAAHGASEFNQFESAVVYWCRAATMAWEEVNDAESYECPGRPSEDLDALRSIILRSYELLTGETARRKDPASGPYVDFFTAAFEALGLDHKKAISQARRALEERAAALEESAPKLGP